MYSQGSDDPPGALGAPPGNDFLMKAVIALGGEVFVLRAEIEALRRLHIDNDAVAARLEDIRAGADYQAWLAAEGERFARNLLLPLGGPKEPAA